MAKYKDGFFNERAQALEKTVERSQEKIKEIEGFLEKLKRQALTTLDDDEEFFSQWQIEYMKNSAKHKLFEEKLKKNWAVHELNQLRKRSEKHFSIQTTTENKELFLRLFFKWEMLKAIEWGSEQQKLNTIIRNYRIVLQAMKGKKIKDISKKSNISRSRVEQILEKYYRKINTLTMMTTIKV